MASEYGAAFTWVVILFIIFIVGIVYMVFTPVIDIFLAIGANSGADPQNMIILRDMIKVWFPIAVVLTLGVYGWRKSSRRVE
jgi:hypothetical protein